MKKLKTYKQIVESNSYIDYIKDEIKMMKSSIEIIERIRDEGYQGKIADIWTLEEWEDFVDEDKLKLSKKILAKNNKILRDKEVKKFKL